MLLGACAVLRRGQPGVSTVDLAADIREEGASAAEETGVVHREVKVPCLGEGAAHAGSGRDQGGGQSHGDVPVPVEIAPIIWAAEAVGRNGRLHRGVRRAGDVEQSKVCRLLPCVPNTRS